jgi:hypothetical protein
VTTEWSEIFQRLNAMNASLERELASSRHEREQRERQRAEDARAGRLGPDLQDLQRRIDAGRTTFLDALSGNDDSPVAQRVRQTATSNLRTMAEQMPPELRDEIDALGDDTERR